MKVKEYFEEINVNKYLGLVPTDKSKETMENMKSYGSK